MPVCKWVDTVRYLGVYIIYLRTFKCCIDFAKQSFYRAFNSLYGKIARTASEEVTLSLIRAKCIPCRLYGLEACPLGTIELNSLHFAVKRILLKIFRTNSNDIIQSGQLYFNFPDTSVLLTYSQEEKVPHEVQCVRQLFMHFV